MAEVTITQFAEVLKVPVERLLSQLEEAGISVGGPDDSISDDKKMKLLNHLREAHGRESDGAAPRKITLKRKSLSELRQSGGGPSRGLSRTVSVEVRKRRTYVKRDVLEAKAREQQEELDRQLQTEEDARAADEAKVRAEAEERQAAADMKAKAAEDEAKREAEEAAREKAEAEAKRLAEEDAQRVAAEQARLAQEARTKAEQDARKDAPIL